MDSGAQEKAKLGEVKRAVRRALVKRRSHLNNSQSIVPLDYESTIVTAGGSNSITVLPSLAATVDMDLYEMNSLEVVAVRQSDQDAVGEELDLCADLDYDHLMQQYFTEETSREPPSCIDYATFLGDVQADEQITFWPASTKSLTQEAVVNLQEATLLMCYLDHVFYIQFPCFESFPSSGIRGWLFSHLRQTNWLFNSTIALAKVYQRSLPQTSHDDLLDFDDADDVGQCYDSALQGLQLALKESHTWTGSIRQTNAVRALMCTSQLMYFEVS
jgi:hypothetical protein